MNYSIRLLTLNAGGCGDTTLASSVSVKPLPPAGIRVSPSTIQDQPDYTFTFEDSAKGLNPQSYLWSMGDRSGQTRSGQRITYEYGDTGTYKVRLRVTDNLTTCSNTDSVNVTIRHIPGYLYVPNAICVGCADNGLRQFLPLGKGLSYYRLRIFTSWGQLIFETTLLNPDGSPKEAWNGTFNNKPIVQDAYRWDIEARYKNNTEWKGMLYPGKSQPIKTGFITVIK